MAHEENIDVNKLKNQKKKLYLAEFKVYILDDGECLFAVQEEGIKAFLESKQVRRIKCIAKDVPIIYTNSEEGIN